MKTNLNKKHCFEKAMKLVIDVARLLFKNRRKKKVNYVTNIFVHD